MGKGATEPQVRRTFENLGAYFSVCLSTPMSVEVSRNQPRASYALRCVSLPGQKGYVAIMSRDPLVCIVGAAKGESWMAFREVA